MLLQPQWFKVLRIPAGFFEVSYSGLSSLLQVSSPNVYVPEVGMYDHGATGKRYVLRGRFRRATVPLSSQAVITPLCAG
jgi:hypothetical protein